MPKAKCMARAESSTDSSSVGCSAHRSLSRTASCARTKRIWRTNGMSSGSHSTNGWRSRKSRGLHEHRIEAFTGSKVVSRWPQSHALTGIEEVRADELVSAHYRIAQALGHPHGAYPGG